MPVEMLDDGQKLETAWNEAQIGAVAYCRALLSSSGSSSWKLVSAPSTIPTRDIKTPPNGLGRVSSADVTVHRRNGTNGEVFRAVVEVDCGTDVNVDTFRGCLATPETRPVWDRMVEEAQLLQLLDTQTRVTKTKYRLGWPSSPRDSVTISKTLVDQHTLLDVSTSLPRSRHEPPFLRPAPPYVRANVSLMGWCIQLPGGSRTDPPLPDGKARITCFWSWNTKGAAWAVGGGVPQHLPSVLVGLVDYVRDGSEKVPVLLEYGGDITISGLSYDPPRGMLSASYAVVRSEDANDGTRRQIEFGLSSSLGWDVILKVKTLGGEETPSAGWSSFVGQSPPAFPGDAAPKRLVVRLVHSQLQAGEELVRLEVKIEQTAPSSSGGRVRINGSLVPVQQMESIVPLKNLLEGSPGNSAISLAETDVTESSRSKNGSPEGSVMGLQFRKGRDAATARSIASHINRNYIYFISLLQEPEPKWRPVAESKDVTVHQLNSIDKTLVVFRAEAVFVGVGIWDLFSTITTPGTRVAWDKTYEDATLLEDVNGLTDLWHFKSKPSWPTAGRDSVLVRTTYKSPSSVHIFGFSTENTTLFPSIPPAIDPNIIRTQIDLQGWSIEALSPDTTLVTLLEQSHPGGWSNKSAIPQVMMSTLTGMGEFAIKRGAPPVVTRLGGARTISTKYDVERAIYRFEYEPAESRRSGSSSTSTFPKLSPKPDEDAKTPTTAVPKDKVKNGKLPNDITDTIECGIRCDPDKWASSLIVTVDPPPKTVSALKRHRLSPDGSGLWVTIEHDTAALGQDSVTVTVRRGAPATGGKVSLTVNGSKIKFDTVELTMEDVQVLKKQKRSRPSRVALDQPVVLRKRQSNNSLRGKRDDEDLLKSAAQATMLGRLYSPLSKLYTTASESTRSIVPMASSPTPSIGSTPVDAAMRALGQLSRIHADRDGESTDPFGWQPVSDRDGLKVEKRIVSHVSDSFPVYRAGRIIEGFTAEEVSAAVSALRKDDYFGKPERLQTYGYGITTSHVEAVTVFPFRSRSALIATVIARVPDSPAPSPSIASHSSLSTIFHASSSTFDPLTLGLDPAKYNPTAMPNCSVILEGWILETIDPYSHEQYAIPSTRCMYVGALDYGGNIPVSVNNVLNSGLPRALLRIEAALKTQGPPSRSRWPPMGVLTPEPSTQAPWALDGIESYKVPIDQVIDGDDYIITVKVQPETSRDKPDHRPGLAHSDSRTSIQSTRSQIVDLAEDIRRGRRDLIVAEIEVGAELVKNGCEVAIRAVSLPEAYHSGGDSSTLPLDFPGDKLGLPFRTTVISLAPSVLQTASLDPTSQTRHLLRVTLPTSGYEAPVNDPLTGKTAPLPRPRWLLDLINEGAVVQIRLLPRVEPAVYMFEGTELPIEDERKLSPRQREPTRLRLPQLVSRGTPNSKPLDKPLAIARQYLPTTPVVIQEDPVESETNSLTSKTPTNEPVELPLEVKPTPVPELKPPPQPRYTFWRLPLNRFASAPVSKHASPVKTPVPLPDRSGAATPQPEVKVIQSPSVRGVPLPAVVIACVICLLLGSLLRSLLSEADFVIYSPGVTSEEWRELKRLGEWRIGVGTDLIIALARRG